MKRLYVYFLIVSLFVTALPGVALAGQGDPLASSGPPINGEAAVLMDAQSGQILYAKNPDEPLAIASITKIMTAIVALEKGNLDAMVTIGPDIMDRKKIYGTLIYLEPGEKFTLRDLLYAMLMNSANDAAVAVADSVGGNVDNFVQMMNAKAKELGATHTHFTNPHGLSEIGHYSSARDMAIFAKYALQNPVFSQIVKTQTRDFPRAKVGLPNKLENHNKMLWLYDGADGVKTGFTDQAGETIVTSATRNGRQLIVVILKESLLRTMYKDAATLLDYGFGQFYNQQLARKGQVVQSVTLADGKVIKLTPARDIYVTLPVGEKPDFSLSPKPSNLSLPVKAGEVRGQLEVRKHGQVIETVPLLALENVGVPLLPQPAKGRYGWYILGTMGVLLMIRTIVRLLNLTRKVRRSPVRARQYRYFSD